MNDTSKVLLTVVIGGTILGAGLSGHVSTLMNPGPEADWRDRYRSSYSDDPGQFVDAGPIDLTPSLSWPGARFGLNSAMAQAPADYGPDYDYEAEYGTGDFAMAQDAADDLNADPSASSVLPAPIEETVHEAATSAAKLQQAAGDSTGPVVPGLGGSGSPDGFEAIGTATGPGAATAL